MYLITGGAGFIGSQVARVLIEKGHAVRILDNLSSGFLHNLDGLDVEFIEGDITDISTVQSAVKDCDKVVHLAAKVSVPESIQDPVGYDYTNVYGTTVVFESARQAGVSRVVYASSSAVYGSTPTLPKQEHHQPQPESPYAVAKLCNEHYGRIYSSTLGVECIGLRFFNVYGPRQDPNGAYAAAIPTFITQANNNKDISLHNGGAQSRDFIFVRDVADAILHSLAAPKIAGEVFNIGNGDGTTILELAQLITQLTHSHSTLTTTPNRPGDILHSCSDISKAKRMLNWHPKITLEDGLKTTVSFYKNHSDNGC